ncbi:MAG: hypothetical protein ACNA8W_03750 [Bradymonadaceae bacterium]
MTLRPLYEASFSIALALLLLASTGCGDTIEIGELDPRIVSVGPLDHQDGVATLSYGLNDPAGNDVDLTFHICDPDFNTCGPAVQQARESDGTVGIPTYPGGTDVTRHFAWHLGCGRLVNDQETAFELETPYVVRITLTQGADEAVSAPFSLREDLGLIELPLCP